MTRLSGSRVQEAEELNAGALLYVAHLPSVEPDLDLLDAVERQRAERFVVPGPADQFVRSRVFLRTVLAGLLGCRAETLRFSFGRHGRPRLNHEEGLDFNLSHSGPWAALVVGALEHGPFGVDVEQIDPTRRLFSLARRFFAEREVVWFESLPRAERIVAFYRLWTLKEAYLKAWGTGLSFSSRRFAFEPEPPCSDRCHEKVGGFRLAATQMEGDRAEDWLFDEFTARLPAAESGSEPRSMDTADEEPTNDERPRDHDGATPLEGSPARAGSSADAWLSVCRRRGSRLVRRIDFGPTSASDYGKPCQR